MKQFIYILLLSSTVVIGNSCERGTVIRQEVEYIDNPPDPCNSKPAPVYFPGEMLYGRVSGLKNCLPFMASAELSFFTYQGAFGTDLIIQTFEDWGDMYVRKELLLVGALAFDKGTFSMYIPAAKGFEASYSTLQDFDILEDVFEIDEAFAKNEMTFMVLDTAAGYAKGYFNCRFLLSTNMPSGNNPDTVIFNDCFFEAWKK